MSDNIPFEIQMEIIERIPDIKLVIQFRSVSKAWKSVIDSNKFVTAHTLRHTTNTTQAHNHHLLIRKRQNHSDPQELYSQLKSSYMSIVDDDTFPCQKHNVFVPDSIDKINYAYSAIHGASHGLFCLYQHKRSTAVIWNPSIRKTVTVLVPNVSREKYYETVIGFGVCPGNLDPKLVKITFVFDWGKIKGVNTGTQVEVFLLSSGGTWRSTLSSNVCHKTVRFGNSQVVIDGVIYWKACDRTNVEDGFRAVPIRKLVMSFDLKTEEFTQVNLPGRLAFVDEEYFSVSNLRESLAILEFKTYTGLRGNCDVWMMIGHGCTRSFNKLYSIDAPDTSIHTTLGFRKSGAPIILVNNGTHDYDRWELAFYEPDSNSNTKIGIYGPYGTFVVYSYVETLLLHDH